jgi:predicted enzyme related to lactoylglutathione lyase
MTDLPAMRLELVPIGVTDIERTKAFYLQAGFDLNVDVEPMPGMRVIQFTPPGSACSIVFGSGMEGISNMPPGLLKGLHLVVDDIETARAALLERGIEVSEPWDIQTVRYASFNDPDGTLWLLQEFPR